MVYKQIIDTKELLDELQKKGMLPEPDEKYPFCLYSLDDASIYSYRIHNHPKGPLEEAVYRNNYFRYAIQLSPSSRIPGLIIEHENRSGTERIIAVNDFDIDGNVYHPQRIRQRRMGGEEKLILIQQSIEIFNRVIGMTGLDILLNFYLKIKDFLSVS